MDLTTQSISTFLTMSGVTTGGERGLLGLAFDPDYSNTGTSTPTRRIPVALAAIINRKSAVGLLQEIL